MLRTMTLVACAVALSVPSQARAQSSERKGGPEKGTWAAEASLGGGFGEGGGQGASLLRFFSPTTAVVGGFSFSRTSFQSRFLDESILLSTAATTNVSLQLGLRQYGGTGLGLRPIYGGGLLFTRRSIWGASDNNNFGGYAEGGAAWFFNPHVSLARISHQGLA